ncbi:MAG: FAD-dependent oxidoreductase [Thermodesulfobacteriota bacterium]
MFPEEAEIVIIGGGILGSSAAYFLAKAGREVVVIEKGDRAGEASAGNAAFVWSLTRRPGIDIRLASHSLEIHRQLQEELDGVPEYRRRGGLLVIDEEKQIPLVEAHVQARNADGFPLQRLDAKETREMEPLLGDHILGAVYNPIDGCANPIYLVIALNRRAKELGAKFYYHTEVSGIEIENNRVKAVVTSRGKVRTDTVVNAAGSWARFIGDMVGVKIPIVPYQMQMIVTEQLPPVMSRILMGASYMVEEYEKEDLGRRGQAGFGCALVASQQLSGTLLLGATWKEAGYDKRTTPEEMEAIARTNLKFFPSLKHVQVIRSYANFFPFTGDDLPIMGRVDGLEGFIMAAGHCGHGICLGPGSGKLIQELICDGRTSLPLEELSLSRFH